MPESITPTNPVASNVSTVYPTSTSGRLQPVSLWLEMNTLQRKGVKE
jgi:hypothetical protein